VPYQTFGFGSEFIGKRDFATNGSFVTTEFRTALLPLYPIRSLRVIEGRTTTESGVFMHSTSTNYTVLAESKPNRKQCVYVFSFTVLCLSYGLALANNGLAWMSRHAGFLHPLWIIQFAIFSLPFLIVLVTRLIVRRKPTNRWLCPCGSTKPYPTCCQKATEERREARRNPHKTFT
jgi:hypothetical protein